MTMIGGMASSSLLTFQFNDLELARSAFRPLKINCTKTWGRPLLKVVSGISLEVDGTNLIFRSTMPLSDLVTLRKTE
jgi:hypothetical protein